VLAKGRKTFAAEVMAEFAEREASDAQRKRIELAFGDRSCSRSQAASATARGGGDPGGRSARAAGRLAAANDLGPRRRNPDRDRRAAARTPGLAAAAAARDAEARVVLK
jgi:hypothetical protein